MRRNSGIIGPLRNPTRTSASGFFDTFDIYNARLLNSWPLLEKYISVSPSTPISLNEGAIFTVTVTTENVVDNTTLYYTINQVSGSITSSDFTDGFLSGSFTITNNTGSFNKTLLLDEISETSDVFNIQIRTGSISGPIVLTSANVTINNPTFSVSPTAPSYDEGTNITWNIITANVSDGTTLYYSLSGTNIESPLEFGSLTGSFVINSNTGIVSVTIANDLLTEGTETVQFNLRTGSVSGTIVATATANINDTSLTPTATITPSVTSVDEGSSVTFTVNTTNFPSGTLSWSIIGTNVTSGDLITTGSVVISGSTGTIVSNITNDFLTEGVETFYLRVTSVRPNGATVILGDSPTITINDTSITPTATVVPDVTSANEGSTVTFTITTSGLPGTATVSWSIIAVSGTINTTDVASTSGTLNTTANVATLARTITNDFLTEGVESFLLRVSYTRPDASVVVLGESPTITINDTSIDPTATVTPSVSSVNEGDSVTFTINTTNLTSGTVSWGVFQSTGNITTGDFVTSITGTTAIASSTGSVNITVNNDFLTEGAESFFLRVTFTRPNGTSLTIGNSSVVTINDTSITPTATITPSVSTVNEGESVTFNITTTNFPSGTLNWNVQAVTGAMTTTDFDLGASGTVTISASTGSVVLNVLNDTFTEGTESFNLRLTIPSNGVVVGTSSNVTINDTSTGTPEPVGLNITTTAYSPTINIITGVSSDYTGAYDVVEVQFNPAISSATGRLFIGMRYTATTSFYNDLCIGAIQVLDNAGNLLDSWAFSNNTDAAEWQTLGAQRGSLDTPLTLSGLTYETIVSGAVAQKWSLASSTGSSSTGAADGVSTLFGSAGTSILTVGNGTTPQTTSTNYVFTESSGVSVNSYTWMRGPIITLPTGTRLRIAYNATSTDMTPNGTLWVGWY